MQLYQRTVINRIFILGFMSLAGLQCIEIPSEPIVPTWDTQLSIPLVDRTKYVSEFVLKDTLLKKASDGGFFYESSQAIDPIAIDEIKANPKQSSQQVTLGTFAIDAPPSLGDTLLYKEITGSDPPPAPITTPAQTYPLPGQIVGPFSSFDRVTFETGILTLRIRNRFPVPIDFPDPIVLKNNNTGFPVDTTEVARFNIATKTFQPGEEASFTANLADKTMQSLLGVQSFRMHAQASNGAVTFTQQSGLEYSLSFSSLTARSAKAKIPKQTVIRVQDSLFTVDDSVSLQSAYFKNGSFNVVMQNNIDAQVSVFLKFNEFQGRTSGAPYTINRTLNGRETVSIPVNARDLKVQSSSTGIGTRITFSAGIETIESQQTREINSTDFFRVELQPQSTLVLESVTGRIKPTYVAINAGASGADFGEAADKFKGNFTFDSIKVALRLGITGGFPTNYDLRLVAMNRRVSPARVDSLVIPAPQGSALKRISPAPGQMAQIVLDNSSGLNTFFSKFFPNFPDTFIVRGSLQMNPPDVYATAQGIQSIYDTTKVYSSVDLSFPLKLSIAGGELTDTVDIDNSEKFPKDFATSVKSGTMFFEINNGLPIQLTLQAALIGKDSLGKRDTLLRIPTDGARTISAAQVDQGGSVTASKTTSFSIRLVTSEIEKFNDADVLWFKFQVETANGGALPVKIRSSDFVRIRASANMVYTVNKP